MKIIQGALISIALTSLVEAGRDGKPRRKLSHKKRLVSRSPLKMAASQYVDADKLFVNEGVDAASCQKNTPLATCKVLCDNTTGCRSFAHYAVQENGFCCPKKKCGSEDEPTKVYYEGRTYYKPCTPAPTPGPTEASDAPTTMGPPRTATPLFVCDQRTMETCFDDAGVEQSCVAIANGGCPCPEGQEKCGGDDTSAGYCTAVCTVDAPMIDPTPAPSIEDTYSPTVGPSPGPTEAMDEPMIDGYTFRGVGCCENDEGQFYDYANYNYNVGSNATVEECAAACEESYSSDEFFVGVNFHPDLGGSSHCHCMKDKIWSGEPAGNGIITGAGEWLQRCADELCYSYNEANPPVPLCDRRTQETCFDGAGVEQSCAAIADGGCPCPGGQAKCGGDDNTWAGYCTAVCCDWRTEETCYDDAGTKQSCAAHAAGGCPCPEGQEKCGAGYCAADCNKKPTYSPTVNPLCDWRTEKICYVVPATATPGVWHVGVADSCVPHGVDCPPCPEGQVKCGADDCCTNAGIASISQKIAPRRTGKMH